MGFVTRVASAIRRAFYEGARSTSNRDFRRAAGSFEETAALERGTLRSRARWLYENNGIISNIDKTIVNNVVGNGLKLQVKSDDKKLNSAIERRWKEWTKPGNCEVTGRFEFGDLQRIVLGQRMMDGEVLVVKRHSSKREHPFRLQIVEADRIDESRPQAYDADVWADGIVLDEEGAPRKYLIRSGGLSMKSVEIPAENALHYYKADNRASQYRGITEYRHAIINLRNLAGYQSALLKAARMRANVGFVVETPDIPGHIGGLPKDKNYDPLYDINGVIVEYLNPGEKIQQLDPKVVGFDYKDFAQIAIREIAVSRNVSYELAFRDYSEVNFSSARASIIQDHKRFSNEQHHLVVYLLRPIFDAWLEANVLAGKIPGLGAAAYYRHREDFSPWWIPPKREWVDPLKDIKALEMEINMGLTTLKQAAAARGDDLEDLIKQREEELKMLKEAGIFTKENDYA